ncbi:MAG: N-acetyl-gamma-glutamyl-phosphate reductase [Sediminicola sp.]
MSTTKTINAGIIGGSGYTGGELIRILLSHPFVSIDFIYSTTRAGKKVASAHPDLLGVTELAFSSQVNLEVDVVFLCLGHGNSTAFLKEHPFSDGTKIVDLSNDFRLRADAVMDGKEFIYGLPEINKKNIEQANYIANPGCFATAIQLALLPLAKEGALGNQVHINAVTGSTGAGVGLSPTSHFSWRTNNLSWYKPFTHQHLGEINERLHHFQEDAGELFFLPSRGNFSRGIFATAYTHFKGSREDAMDLYGSFYADAKFTQVSDTEISLKQVVNTNQCHIHLHKHNDMLLVTSTLDNLLKGASGQAVQNMNLMFGFKETEALALKSVVF